MNPTPSAEEQSKDRHFQSLAKLAEAMAADHGRDFAAGALILAARWVVENRLGEAGDTTR